MSTWHDYKGKYDPADFVVPPNLNKGESMRLQFNVQAAHWRLLNVIARSGHFPFSHYTDVARWCIQFGLQYIDSLPDEVAMTRSVMSQANTIGHFLAEQVKAEKYLHTLEDMKLLVHGHLIRGEEDEARADVMKIYNEIRRMPDAPEREFRWKLKYLETVEKEFKHLLPEQELQKLLTPGTSE